MFRTLVLAAGLSAGIVLSACAADTGAVIDAQADSAGRCSEKGFSVRREDRGIVVSGTIEVPNPNYRLAVAGATLEDARTMVFDVRVAEEDPGAIVNQVIVERPIEVFAASRGADLRTVVLFFDKQGFDWGAGEVICDIN